ncbi:AAA family ATPase [Gloeobacter kilaueensis]|uniref:Recombination protein F n=1 Tax=Gloeobacter kilaueensis (strain ATCC BAA-2537 / CCAP 1431/1 / ULC 316 / JS1) TaxID=1183438 RepID=U5QLY4_GLOK1|nr:AAA family ATPase [Gloeobacter kilaueensis]AGY59921.1 recombination protein F [Gloeobacter kilaueensis JS1]
MLTRLKVSGFKNLVDVDIRFGSFTCIAGANGVGKSNLFDAILFLSALTDRPLIDAALSVREEGGRSADLRSLFHRFGGSHYTNEMCFVAEMIVPREGQDDLGQTGKASITFLQYSLNLAYRTDSALRSLGSLEITKEELTHITLGDASKHLLFPHSAKLWRRSVITGKRHSPYFISTEGEGDYRVIKLHQDGGSSGRPLSRSAINLPRTVLSVTNAAESPTALLARREMQSWRLLQLEPSALRKPDEFTAPQGLGADGSHLPATLYRLAQTQQDSNTDPRIQEASIYARVANRLSELIDDVRNVTIDRDEKRELLSLLVSGKDQIPYAARALSDGTLRFLALAVLELDSEAQGVLCLEEPENGIHPERIPAILRLLKDIAVDVDETMDENNSLRQVIINTHSPAVVAQVPDDSLVVAELKESMKDGFRFRRASFSCLENTWRARAGMPTVARGKLLSYLNPIQSDEAIRGTESRGNGKTKTRRVIDRPDLQLLLPIPNAEV